MSNRAPKRSKGRKRRQRAAGKQEGNFLLRAILGAATLVGGIAAVVTFFPRTSVTASEPVDVNNPFSSSITVTNSGWLPLNDVDASVAIRRISNIQVRTRGDPNFGTRLTSDQMKGHNLGVDDRFTFALNDLVFPPFQLPSKDLAEADIAIVIQYRIPILRIKQEKIFPFIVRRQSNGNFYWYAESPAN
jgi:hypothetical protein